METFRGHYDGMSNSFSHSYDGENVHLGEINLKVNKATTTEATGLSSAREKYFKGVVIDKTLCLKFLNLEHLNYDWRKGISHSWIKHEYWNFLISLHRFLTCEGRYDVTFLYHLRLLLHLEGGLQIHFPYFLRMSLSKMARGVKFSYKKHETIIYHHGSMKLLVVHELRNRVSSWKKLLTHYFSQEDVSKSMGKDGTRECRKEYGNKVGNNKSNRKKPSSGVDNVGPNSPKSVNKLDKGKIVKSGKNIELRVK